MPLLLPCAACLPLLLLLLPLQHDGRTLKMPMQVLCSVYHMLNMLCTSFYGSASEVSLTKACASGRALYEGNAIAGIPHACLPVLEMFADTRHVQDQYMHCMSYLACSKCWVTTFGFICDTLLLCNILLHFLQV